MKEREREREKETNRERKRERKGGTKGKKNEVYAVRKPYAVKSVHA